MVFSSFPNPHIDSSNWNQQHHQHQEQQQQQQNHLILQHHGISISNPLLPPPPLPPPLQPPGQPPAQTGPMGSIRPGSMSERARMANIPMPEPGLKCPRCDSTNTKFCYFNNYSLSQPRHFCKTCRRYWTRGGAMRSVPVGGGCRRNKRRSKSSSSSSAATAATSSASSAPGSHSLPPQSMAPPNPLPSLRFMSPLHQLADYGGGELGFLGGAEQWRPPPLPPSAQPPIFGGLGFGLFRSPFEGVHDFSSLAIGGSGGGGPMRAPAAEPVKMERSHRAGEQYEWGGESSSSGNAWTDLTSAINNSSCSNTSAM